MLRYLGITGAGRTTTWIGQNGTRLLVSSWEVVCHAHR